MEKSESWKTFNRQSWKNGRQHHNLFMNGWMGLMVTRKSLMPLEEILLMFIHSLMNFRLVQSSPNTHDTLHDTSPLPTQYIISPTIHHLPHLSCIWRDKINPFYGIDPSHLLTPLHACNVILSGIFVGYFSDLL